MAEWSVFRAPAEVVWGRGVAELVGEFAERRGRKVLVVTDRGVSASGIAGRVVELLRVRDLEVRVVDDVLPEFDYATVGAVAASAAGSEVIVAVGGGSCMDMAKLAALQLAEGGDVRRFIGEGLVTRPILPVIAVPTTAGTGSEATPVAVATDAERGIKAGVSSRYLIPEVALVDPELTDGCPSGVTAASGIDALTHAIESYTATVRSLPMSVPEGFIGRNPLSDSHALEAVRLIGASLADCVVAPHPGARDLMSRGSLLAGISFGQAGTGLAHALQYPIGHLTHTSHGLGVGLMLPYVMEFTAKALPERFDDIARALGREPGDGGTMNSATAAVLDIRKAIGIPHTLSEIADDLNIEEVARDTAAITRLTQNNGRRASTEDIAGIIRASLSGDFALIP